MFAAEKWLALAKQDGEALAQEESENQQRALLASVGLGPEDKVPTQLKPELKALTDDQKRRTTRAIRDGLDRILLDLASAYRDIASIQLESGMELVNESIRDQLEMRARASRVESTLEVLDEIKVARKRIERNVRDLLAMEALATKMIFRGWGN